MYMNSALFSFLFYYFSVWSTEMEIWFPVRWKRSSSIWCQRTSTTRTSHTFLLFCSVHGCLLSRTSFCSKHVISAISSSSWTFISTTTTTPPSQIRYLWFNDHWLEAVPLWPGGFMEVTIHWNCFHFIFYTSWTSQLFFRYRSTLNGIHNWKVHFITVNGYIEYIDFGGIVD